MTTFLSKEAFTTANTKILIQVQKTLDFTPFHVGVIFVDTILDRDSKILITDESPGKRRQNRPIFQPQFEFIGLTRRKKLKKKQM